MAGCSLTDLTEAIINKTGYLKELELVRTDEARDRIANVKELLSETKEFDIHDEEKTLDSFLGNIALYSETDELNDDNRVTLITLHMAKGLEYKIVFIAGMEEGIFPHFRSLGSSVEMEEERRLCYVGITRGREKVYLTRAYLRNQYGITRGNEMSRFINEIPSALKDFPHKEQAVAKKTYERDTFMSRSSSVENTTGEEPILTGFRLGDKVFHSKFGEGVVVQIEGEGKDLLLSIAFPNSGIKKLLAMYAPIKKLSR
jgi:DNA helicase-2/ATP-dependent DNA helicase PcrA